MSEAAFRENQDRGYLVLAHHHPGRLRVRVRSGALEEDCATLEAIERWLTEQPGVRAVCTHTRTGSVLVTYDTSEADAGDLFVGIASHGDLDIAEEHARRAPAQAVFAAFRAVDDFTLRSSKGRWGLGFVLPLALGIGSVGSFLFSAHRRAPRWDNLLYWGVQLFRSMNEERAQTVRHADGG
jgi:Heavy metal associated domain 2